MTLTNVQKHSQGIKKHSDRLILCRLTQACLNIHVRKSPTWVYKSMAQWLKENYYSRYRYRLCKAAELITDKTTHDKQDQHLWWNLCFTPYESYKILWPCSELSQHVHWKFSSKCFPKKTSFVLEYRYKVEMTTFGQFLLLLMILF